MARISRIDRLKQQREYYSRNRERLVEYSRKYREKRIKENGEEFREISRRRGRRFNKTPKGIYHAMKNNSRTRGRDFNLEQDKFILWYHFQDKVCHYCGRPEGEKRLEIDRMDNSIGYVLENMTLACGDCNDVKGRLLTEKEMLLVGRLIMRKRWQ